MSGGRLLLILGGARSGKSDYAVRLAKRAAQPVTFVATAQARDSEMARRIELHRRSRPAGWTTVEAPQNLAATLRHVRASGVVLLDDLGLLVANHLLNLAGELSPQAETAPVGLEAVLDAKIDDELRDFIALLDDGIVTTAIVVSNEVGMGIVPATVLGRLQRDVLGRSNQRLAARADTVVLCVAGLPNLLKGVDPMSGGP